MLGLEGKRGKGGDGASPPEGAELDGGTIGIVAVLALTLARFLCVVAGIGGGRVGGAGLGLGFLGILSLLGVGGAVGLASRGVGLGGRGLIVSCRGALLAITLTCLNGGADLSGDI